MGVRNKNGGGWNQVWQEDCNRRGKKNIRFIIPSFFWVLPRDDNLIEVIGHEFGGIVIIVQSLGWVAQAQFVKIAPTEEY